MKELIKLVLDFVMDYPGYSITAVILFVLFIFFTIAACDENIIKKDHVPWFW